jgi:hypothetical protein
MARLIREAGVADKPVPTCAAFPYTLRARRSYLKVQLPQSLAGDAESGGDSVNTAVPVAPAIPTAATSGDGLPPLPTGPLPPGLTTPSPGTQRATANDSVPIESPVLVLGPIERWFFSADLAVPSLSADLKWGSAPEADQERIDANEFFVAINAALGDLLVDRDSVLQRRPVWQELVFKLQMEVSRRPWNSWALGMGLRGDRLKAILWNMDVVHPFVAVGRERLPDTDDARWRVSVGFGFDPRSLSRGN